jgi:hypothetical protein
LPAIERPNRSIFQTTRTENLPEHAVEHGALALRCGRFLAVAENARAGVPSSDQAIDIGRLILLVLLGA